MSSLRVISLTILADSIHNILIFFAEKMWVAFALQNYSHFFSNKYQNICVSLDVNFNESLTNYIISFEQLGPVVSLWFDLQLSYYSSKWKSNEIFSYFSQKIRFCEKIEIFWNQPLNSLRCQENYIWKCHLFMSSADSSCKLFKHTSCI